jgi:hypothetical protein
MTKSNYWKKYNDKKHKWDYEIDFTQRAEVLGNMGKYNGSFFDDSSKSKRKTVGIKGWGQLDKKSKNTLMGFDW